MKLSVRKHFCVHFTTFVIVFSLLLLAKPTLAQLQCTGLPTCDYVVYDCESFWDSDVNSCQDSCPSYATYKCTREGANNPQYYFDCCTQSTLPTGAPLPTPTPLPIFTCTTGSCTGSTSADLCCNGCLNYDQNECSCSSLNLPHIRYASCTQVTGSLCPATATCPEGQAPYFEADHVATNYLYSCCYSGTGAPPPPGPGGGVLPTPDPTYPGWPPGYPNPPAEAYPLPYVRCQDVRPGQSTYNPASIYETEFHSLRPYQASPCDRNFRELALYCGNSLILQVDQTVSYNYTSPPGTCTRNGDQDTCSWIFSGADDVAIDLSGAEYPIMGYTEPSRNNMNDPYKVVNALNPDPADETVDDNAKVNEYVSWYLQGAMDHAESVPLDVSKNCIGESTGRQGTCKDTAPSLFPNACSLNLPTWQFDGKGGCGNKDMDCCVSSVFDRQDPELDRDRLINLSGPIRKLLPQSIQFREKIDEVNNAFLSTAAGGNNRIRHNQVAGCTIGITIPFINRQIGGFQFPCYKSNILLGDYGSNPSFIHEVRLSDWSTHNELPPLEEDYSNRAQYLSALHSWRGLFCVSFVVPDVIPLFGGWSFDMCFDDPTQANFWSNLYDNIPTSSTEDFLGYVEPYTSAAVQSNTQHVTITQASFTPLNGQLGFAFLYVPHMDEANEVVKPLQRTYAPKGADLTEDGPSVSGEVDPFCDLREVRTNPGDQLFAGEIQGTVNYQALVTQDFYNGTGTSGAGCSSLGGSCVSLSSTPSCGNYYDNFDCPSGDICCTNYQPYSNTVNTCVSAGGVCLPSNYNCSSVIASTGLCSSGYSCYATACTPSTSVPIQNYTAPIRIELKLRTAIPFADDVWNRLVAGAAGVARRMFPKIMADSNSPFEFFWDMPGETSVNYSITSNSNATVGSGNPYSLTVQGGQGAKLYFPHLGGIKEYFLNGIQTLLRPKGYGYSLTQTTTDAADNTNVVSTTCTLGVGPCSPESLAQYFPGHEIEASAICQAESSSNPFAMNTQCLWSADGLDNDNDGPIDLNDSNYDGATADYSIGLFQINLLAHCAGNSGFSQWTLSPPYLCVVSNQSLVDSCTLRYQDPVENILEAVRLSNGGTNWTPWTNAALKCGFL